MLLLSKPLLYPPEKVITIRRIKELLDLRDLLPVLCEAQDEHVLVGVRPYRRLGRVSQVQDRSVRLGIMYFFQFSRLRSLDR